MRSGYAPQTTGVTVGTVTVDGVPREATSVSTERELGGGGVPGMKATAAAEGNAEWAQLVNASSAPAYSPWTRTGNWPPATGSAIQVTTGTQFESFRMLTGVVSDSGAGSDGLISSSLIDPVDRLHREVTILPMLAVMPPNTFGGPLRAVGMSSDWVASKALRLCGFHSTPPLIAASPGVDVPGWGSVWPERGTCLTASNFVGTAAADFLSSEWGWGMYSVDATYSPDGTLAMSGMEASALVSEYHAASSAIRVSPVGSSAMIELVVNSDRSIKAQYTYDGTSTVVATLPAVAKTFTRVSMRVSAGSIWLGTNDGRVASGTNPAPSSVMSANVQTVAIRAVDGSRIGGVVVGVMPSGYYHSFKVNARLYAGTSLNPKMVATPAILREDGLDLLSEIANASCRSYWWDEDGMLSWIPGDYMMARTSSLTITSKDNLINLGWSESLADTYESVAVGYKTPVVSRSRFPDVMVWQGSGDSMGSNETKDELVYPASDEDWIQPDASPILAQGSFLSDLNLGRRSLMGGIRTDGNTTSWAYLSGGTEYLKTTIKYISALRWKFTYETAGLPTGESIQRAMPNETATTGFWQRWRNEKLPIIRAYGKTAWADASVAAGSGPPAAGTYQHDGDKWVQGYSDETAGRIAAFLADWLCKPRIRATDVEVIHDPRIQVGDVVTVRDEHAHGVELKVLVTRVKQTVSAGASSMILDFFVIEGGSAWRTLGDHNAAGTGSLSAHNTQESGESMGEHNADPWHNA